MKLYSPDGSELMRVESLERDGSVLLIKGKVFGAMPMTARLKPAEARIEELESLARLAFFLLTFLMRRS